MNSEGKTLSSLTTGVIGILLWVVPPLCIVFLGGVPLFLITGIGCTLTFVAAAALWFLRGESIGEKLKSCWIFVPALAVAVGIVRYLFWGSLLTSDPGEVLTLFNFWHIVKILIVVTAFGALQWNHLAAAAVSFVAAGVILASSDIEFDAGHIWALAACIVWGGYAALSEHDKRVNDALAFAMLIAGVVCIATSMSVDGFDLPSITECLLLLAAGLAMPIAVYLWRRGFEGGHEGAMWVGGLFSPVMGVGLMVLIGPSSLTPALIAGLVLLIAVTVMISPAAHKAVWHRLPIEKA